MLKALIILPFSFSIWFGLVKIFSKNEETSINILLNKVFRNFSLVFIHMLDIFDSLFKSFIQTYEFLGLVLKNIGGIFKSIISTFAKFLYLFKLIGITIMSFISLCKGLYKETKNITLLRSVKELFNQTKSAKNNVVNLFKVKEDELTLER